jgi:exodeoxyribonuclease VII small subunit
MDSTIKDFEAAIAELETIVKKLEEGDLPLETSLQLYERGVQLSRFCHAQLERAEKRIEILNERGGLTPAPANFGADDDPSTGAGSPRAESRGETEGRGRR